MNQQTIIAIIAAVVGIGFVLFCALAAYVAVLTVMRKKYRGKAMIWFQELNGEESTEYHVISDQGTFISRDEKGQETTYYIVHDRRILARIEFFLGLFPGIPMDKYMYLRGQSVPMSPLNHKSSLSSERANLANAAVVVQALLASFRQTLAGATAISLFLIIGLIAVAAIGAFAAYTATEAKSVAQANLIMTQSIVDSLSGQRPLLVTPTPEAAPRPAPAGR